MRLTSGARAPAAAFLVPGAVCSPSSLLLPLPANLSAIQYPAAGSGTASPPRATFSRDVDSPMRRSLFYICAVPWRTGATKVCPV